MKYFTERVVSTLEMAFDVSCVTAILNILLASVVLPHPRNRQGLGQSRGR